MGILDLFKLDGKTALVTGCRRGIGRGYAQALAEAGADIVGVSQTLAPGSEIEKDVTALVTASPYTPKTAALVVVAAAHLQPTQQQRKHANRVRNGLTAGLGGAHGTHHVDGPRARQQQPSPSPDAHRSRPTCRSQISAQHLPHAPVSRQMQRKKHPSPPPPKPAQPTAG